MEIDIISYTAEQFALLSEEQLLEVKSAQLKKNRLLRQLEEELEEEKAKLVENGIYHCSKAWDTIVAKLQERYDAEVEWVRDTLLFYLHYSYKPQVGEDSPYKVDYSLSAAERLAIVREYYETNFTDDQKRYDAFVNDPVVKKYLGEDYSGLLAYYKDLTIY